MCGHIGGSFRGLHFRNVKHHESRFGKHNPKTLKIVYGSCDDFVIRKFFGPTLVLRGSRVDGDLQGGFDSDCPI